MRRLADADRIDKLLRALGREAREETRLYLVGGATMQALAKVERGHAQDRADVQALLDAGLIDREEALLAFERIEPELYRYPAIDPATFRRAVEEAFGKNRRR